MDDGLWGILGGTLGTAGGALGGLDVEDVFKRQMEALRQANSGLPRMPAPPIQRSPFDNGDVIDIEPESKAVTKR